ncbi:FAD-dependent oxidoreductase [Megasphaera sp.]|uniref:FAD-dependent oxidoreductase n=1 Tax=Megasphaera sp. TaxID=2023260 RepID=UPI0025DBAECC|nr:FAD-dependent oxidoreductase [uncultured Megasphaera sp.]
MQYTEEMRASQARVEATRNIRLSEELPRFTAEEKKELLRRYHPDYNEDGFAVLSVGPNKGDKVPRELAALLQGQSRMDTADVDLGHIQFDTDVLVIGGGGAGAAAAIEAARHGAKVLMATKLRLGDANTGMAEGGIQAADKESDSPADHYLDAIGGGHYKNKPELLAELVLNGPEAIHWLSSLGVLFDKEADGSMVTTHGGGTSRKRMHACGDYTGAEIMRVLRDEVRNAGVDVVEYSPAVELLLDGEGKAAGAVLYDFDTQEYHVVRAKSVIIATGGAGRLHYQGFPTSNHYGSTADGLVLAYRAGVPLIYADAIQYHPTGAAYPPQIYGALVTEKVRSLGAMLVNKNGEAFLHPLETRDVVAAAIIRECQERDKGIYALHGPAVWLDTPMVDLINGEGTMEKRLPAMIHMYDRFGIDIRRQPILVYPTLHYQNGGICIDADSATVIPGLYAAGEDVGGIHGTNRLMGNSLLDIIVFGRKAGTKAAAYSKTANPGPGTLDHVRRFDAARAEAGLTDQTPSPKLLPNYTHNRGTRG